MTRKEKGTGSIYQRRDGLWCAELNKQYKYAKSKEKAIELLIGLGGDPYKYTEKKQAWDIVIYFVLAPITNRIKIGHSKNLTERLKSIQANCPEELKLLGYIRGNKDMELLLHDIFSEYRLHGEWFDYTPALKKMIDAIDKVEATT